MKTALCIDADYLVYSAGFATEKVEYLVSAVLPGEDGQEVEDIVDTKAAAEAWREGRDWPLGTRHREPQRLVTPEPLPHAKLILRNILKKIRDRAKAHFGGAPDDEFIYITGSDNFRMDIATIKPYKGNRAALHKPVHYGALREYLVNLGATVINGMEADDAVAEVAFLYGYHPEAFVLAAVDKDLWTVPGLHYNFQKDEWSLVTPKEALVNFYTQLLTGDTVDNIGGCYRAGPAFAGQHLTPDMTETEMYDTCLRAYELSLEKDGCPYAGLSAESALLENARLLHLRRFAGDLWVPPGQRPVAASSVISCETATSEGSPTSTSQTVTQSLSQSPGSLAPSAELSSLEVPATPQTSSSPVRSTTSKRKGSSRRTKGGGYSRSRSST